MRTITRTYDLFQLAELSAAARDTAYNEWLRTFEYGWESDNRNTLEAFESVFKVKVNGAGSVGADRTFVSSVLSGGTFRERSRG